MNESDKNWVERELQSTFGGDWHQEFIAGSGHKPHPGDRFIATYPEEALHDYQSVLTFLKEKKIAFVPKEMPDGVEFHIQCDPGILLHRGHHVYKKPPESLYLPKALSPTPAKS